MSLSDISVAYPRFRVGLVLLVAYALTGAQARGDIFVLESGGRIEGEWLNRDEQPLVKYTVRSGGTTFVLPAHQVRESIRQTPAQVEYAQRMPFAADTVEGQWELAEWCRKHSLTAERQAHLRRIVELNPNHPASRSALGYQFINGQWITRSDFRRDQGFEYYRGKWRTPQEIEILEEQGRMELAEKEWLGRLRRWRKDLDDREKAKQAHDSLMAIQDPVAIRPLGELFARERARVVKTLYADVLANIRKGDAVRVLAERALSDADEELFYYCIDKLSQLNPPHIADLFIAALKDNSNLRVNRAATALARLRDKSAISPLIDALITTHSQIVNNPLAGATTTTFSNDGSVGKQGGNGPELVVYHVQNQPVLDALSKLTGADFGFDQKAWRYWHAQEKIAREAGKPVVDVRRD